MNPRTSSMVGRLPTITDPATGRVYPIIAGADGDDTEALLSRLGSETEPLDDDELAELEAELLAAFDDADGDDPDVERMEQVADQLDSVRAEQDARAEAAEARLAQADEIRSRVRPAEPTAEDAPADGDDDEPEGDEPEAEASDDEPADDEPAEEPAKPEAASQPEPEPARQPVAAAATPTRPARPTRTSAAAHRPASHRPRPRPQDAGPTIVASGDIPGVSAGSHLTSVDQVGRAFADKLHAVLAGGGRGRFPVVSIQVDYPDERTLGHNAELNEERVEAVLASITQDAIVAAGGLCAPVEVSYDLPGISTDRRPLRDALTRFGASRGGIRFIEPPKLSDIIVDTDGTYPDGTNAAVAVWTEATDTDPGENRKPVQTITCGDEVEVLVEAITKGLKVGNFNRRFFAEQFSRWWQLATAAHARTAEARLFASMETLSTAVTSGQLLGAARDILTTIDRAVASFRSRHRMADNAPLRLVIPDWTRDLMRADLARQMAGDDTLSVSNEQLAAHFAVRNVNVTYTPDAGQQFGAQGAGALVGWPTEVTGLLYPDGHFLFVDGGELDFGMEIRDSTLNKTNDSEAFLETFENVAFRGVESLAITMDVCASGEASGTVDIDPCTTGS